MSDAINLIRTDNAHERSDPPRKPRAVNSRYAVTFSQADYDVLRDFCDGTKVGRFEAVRAILRRRLHYG